MVVYDFVVFLTYQDTHRQGSLFGVSIKQLATSCLARCAIQIPQRQKESVFFACFFRKLSILNRYTMIYDDSSRFMMHRFFVLKWLQVKHGSHYWDSTYFEIFWNMKYVENGWNMCNICWHIWSEKLSPQTFRALNATAWPLRERWGTPCWTPLTGKRPHPMSRAPAKASVLTALLQTCLARCL